MEQKLDIQQLIKETVAHAKNAWGSEDSKIASMVLEKMRGHIEHTIDDKIQPILVKLDKYIDDDNKWKNEAKPVLEMGRNVQGFGKVSLYILGFIASVMGAIYGIMEFVKHKTQ